jgi:phosphoribosylpyrophosphate synthetase
MSCALLIIFNYIQKKRRLGLELGKCVVLKYSNQETSVTIGESGMITSFGF